MRICVTNMFSGTGANELQQAFSPYGAITSIETFPYGESGEAREFALVEMADDNLSLNGPEKASGVDKNKALTRMHSNAA